MCCCMYSTVCFKAKKADPLCILQVGSFFMINLCLVVIATQFSETKQRENQLMQEQRARYMSNDSTLASYSEPGSCYEELLRYISHLYRKVKRRAYRLYQGWQSKRRKKVNPNSGALPGGGGANGHGRQKSGGHWARSVHNLVQHHQHHHCHLSNGSPSPQAIAESTDVPEMRFITSGVQLTVPPQSPAGLDLSPGHQSVHSIFQGDFHEASQICTATTAGVTPLGRLNGGMNYPTILPSFICSYTGSNITAKGRIEANNSPADILDPFEKLQHLTGEHSKSSFFCSLHSSLHHVTLPPHEHAAHSHRVCHAAFYSCDSKPMLQMLIIIQRKASDAADSRAYQ